MKVIILSGFLGAGKTSVLLQLAKHLTAQDPDNPNRIAIIENEIGDIGVDDQTLGGSGSYQVKSLFSGCICCTLIGEVAFALKEMKEQLNPDYVVIEPSGVAEPGFIAKNIKMAIDLDARITSIVDAQRWARISRAMGTLLSSQLASAHLILVNKVDKVDDEALAKCEADLRGFNGSAPIRRITANTPIDEQILEAIAGEVELDA